MQNAIFFIFGFFHSLFMCYVLSNQHTIDFLKMIITLPPYIAVFFVGCYLLTVVNYGAMMMNWNGVDIAIYR